MKTKVYKLYGTTAVNANALAQVIIQRDGYIHGILGNVTLNSGTTGHYVNAELSFQSVAQTNTNDTNGPFFEISLWVFTGAAGCVQNSRSEAISGLAIPVKAGDRLYLNVQAAASSNINAYIYVAE